MDYALQDRDRIILELIADHNIKPHHSFDKLYALIHKQFPRFSEDDKETIVAGCITWAAALAISGQSVGRVEH